MTTLLEQEIASQPVWLAHLLDCELDAIGQIAAQLPPFDYVLIAARGSSDHAAEYAKYAWGSLAGLPVALAAPALHTLYHTPPRLGGALVVGISQSGQSPDIVAVLAEGKRQGRPTIAITNDGGSPLALAADHVVELHVGAERSVAATKTYTAQLAVMAAFAAHWSGQADHLAALRQLPDTLGTILQATPAIAARAAAYRAIDQCAVIGRGFNLATAHELALKLKELTYIGAIAYSSADFRHGPIATIGQGSPVILVAPTGHTLDDIADLAADLQARGADLLIISDAPDLFARANFPLPLAASVSEWLSPITAILPGQILALHLAQAKGINPDLPRGLNKVTKTL